MTQCGYIISAVRIHKDLLTQEVSFLLLHRTRYTELGNVPAQHHHSSGWSARHGSEWGAGLRQPERRTSQFQVLVLADCPQPPPSHPVEKQKSCQPLLFANWHDTHSAGLHACRQEGS